MSNEPEEINEGEERTYYEMSLENDDGTRTKVLEYESLGSSQLEPSEQKDSVTLKIPVRIKTFVPVELNQSVSLVLSREQVQKMAEMLGLIDS